MSSFWCTIASVLIGAGFVALVLAAILGVTLLIAFPCVLLSQRRERFYNSLSKEERLARLQKASDRRQFWAKVGNVIGGVFLSGVVLLDLYAFGSPICDAVFHHGH